MSIDMDREMELQARAERYFLNKGEKTMNEMDMYKKLVNDANVSLNSVKMYIVPWQNIDKMDEFLEYALQSGLNAEVNDTYGWAVLTNKEKKNAND